MLMPKRDTFRLLYQTVLAVCTPDNLQAFLVNTNVGRGALIAPYLSRSGGLLCSDEWKQIIEFHGQCIARIGGTCVDCEALGQYRPIAESYADAVRASADFAQENGTEQTAKQACDRLREALLGLTR
jgi:hypothetical protein